MRDEAREATGRRDKALDHFRPSPGPAAAAVGDLHNAVPFRLSSEEEAGGMQWARAHLTQLMAECAAPPPIEEAHTSTWTRVNRTRKQSASVSCWEKHAGNAASALKTKETKRRSSVPSRVAALTRRRGSGPTSYSVRSSTTVDAPLNAVLRALDASVATAHRSFTRIIYGPLVTDTAVLCHSSTPPTDLLGEGNDDSLETLAVRWLTCRCSNPTVHDCDFCLQEYTKRHTLDEVTRNTSMDRRYKTKQCRDDTAAELCDERAQSDGQEGLHALDDVPAAYKLFRSIETRHCPELLKSHRLVRCNVPLGGFLLYPTTRRDRTDVVFYMNIAQDAGAGDRTDRRRKSASSAALRLTQCSDRQFHALRTVARQMALHIGRLNYAVDSYRMVRHLESLRSLQWVNNAERQQCIVCCRRFRQLTRRRHHCRLCGEVICRECSVQKDVTSPTSGPAMLRICTRCNQTYSPSQRKVSSRSDPEVSVSSQALQRCRDAVRRDRSTGKSMLDPMATSSFSETRRRQRNSSLREEMARSVIDESEWPVLAERSFFVTASEGAAHHVDTFEDAASSGSQRALSSASDSWHFASTSRSSRTISTIERPFLTTASGTSDPARPPISKVDVHRAFSANIFSASRNQEPSPLPSRCELRAGDGRNMTCADNSDGNHEPLITMTGICTLIRLNNRPWSHRSFETPDVYEDIFLKLCETAASVRNSQFVALTLYTRTTEQDEGQQDDVEAAGSTVSYLKVRGCAKLMKITTANLRCCEPVLQLQTPVVTRNTWALDESSIHPSGYDFRQLPIVMGSQRARFYAGVPLVNTNEHYRYGALAVFDAKTSRGRDDDLSMKKTLQALQVCTEEAMMAADERRQEIHLRTFLQASLIPPRRSEPALRPSVDIQESDPQWLTIERIDGDSHDKDGVDEDYRYKEYDVVDVETNSTPAFTNSGTSRVGKARVDYFQSKLQQLVQQAQDTQAQMVENTLVMERHRLPIVE
ncbi:unnamed protein product [Hyaloperonospora brassicae]|uniref:FYVE-type domain-containing protein n=1 Tax=Hyaloperonospora brassicae TaxID=162125 RepID=A0AAV0UJA5_HYABA|nr:unnamed protein product [Hyaloperonospora brassicae]